MAQPQQVNPVDGTATGPTPGNAPIPRRQTRFRAAPTLGGSIAQPIPAFPVSTGIAPLLAYADGYNAVEVPRSGPNTVFVSYLDIALRVFYTNQRLVTNDKFLKEVHLFHPDALDLYCSFIFVYHNLRVRSQIGTLSSSEATILSDLEREYPPSSIPVPGTIVDALQTITATENPYSWLGNIAPQLPDVNDFSAPAQAYRLNNNRHIVWPNFKFSIAQLVGVLARARPTDATFVNIHNVRFTSPGALAGNQTQPVAIRTDATERFWLQTPQGRVPNLVTLRVAQQFHDAAFGSANAPFYSEFALDLPHMNAIAANANGTLTSYMGLIDDEGVQNRVLRYRRWPAQLAPMVATINKYVSGSRHLSDIPTTGLGALHHIARYTNACHFEIRDPAAVQGGAAAALNAATYAAFHLTSLTATLRVRDPVASDLSIQYQMLAQTNVNLEDAEDGQGNALGPAFVQLRQGDFWDYPIAENGPESAVANIIMSHLPNLIKANPRRDNTE